MSEQQTEKMKLRRIGGSDVEETCKQILGGKPLEEINDLFDSYKEALIETQWENKERNYEVTDKGVFEVLEYERFNDPDIFEASENGDGTIDVLVSYYNGGCSTPEAIEAAIGNMEKNNET